MRTFYLYKPTKLFSQKYPQRLVILIQSLYGYTEHRVYYYLVILILNHNVLSFGFLGCNL